jgi:hypothetical protein
MAVVKKEPQYLVVSMQMQDRGFRIQQWAVENRSEGASIWDFFNQKFGGENGAARAGSHARFSRSVLFRILALVFREG